MLIWHKNLCLYIDAIRNGERIADTLQDHKSLIYSEGCGLYLHNIAMTMEGIIYSMEEQTSVGDNVAVTV